MEEELVKLCATLFNSYEKWNSFLEFAKLRDKFIDRWYAVLCEEIPKKIELDDKWTFDKKKVQWYLKEFGESSISLWLEGSKLCLWTGGEHNYFTNIRNKIINEVHYTPLKDAVDFQPTDENEMFIEFGKFEFGTSDDNKFDDEHLAWFAGNETEEFIEQLNKKLQTFFKKEITDLLIELNRLPKN